MTLSKFRKTRQLNEAWKVKIMVVIILDCVNCQN